MVALCTLLHRVVCSVQCFIHCTLYIVSPCTLLHSVECIVICIVQLYIVQYTVKGTMYCTMYCTMHLKKWLLKGLWTLNSDPPIHAKMTMPDLQWYPRTIHLIKNVEDTLLFLTRKVLISVSFSIAFYKQYIYIQYASLSRRETTNETKTLISNFNFIILSFQGFRSDISIFARMVICNYAYSLFNSALRLWWLSKLKNPLFQNKWTHKTRLLNMFSKDNLKKMIVARKQVFSITLQ